MPGPLSGIRVLDLTQYMQGPWGTQLLGDLGADVIKVEKPNGGDWERANGYNDFFLGGDSACFLAMNRNKRSITINLKCDAGRQLALRLAKTVDVFAENFRPGVIDRLGLGYDAVKAVNPGIVYLSATGYGPDGPYSARPGQDLLIQSLTGVPYLTGRAEDVPTPAGIPIADQQGARMVVIGILAALLHRERTGVGQKVEVSLLNSLLDAECQEAVTFLNGGGIPQRSRSGVAHAYLNAPYGIYETSDGYMAISQTPLERLARAFGDPSWASDYEGRGLHEIRDELRERLQGLLRTRTTAEWLEVMAVEDIWCGPVVPFEKVFDDPQVRHNGMVQTVQHPRIGELKVTGIPVAFSSSPGSIDRPPPLLGEHTDEILREAGVDSGEIATLRSSGAI